MNQARKTQRVSNTNPWSVLQGIKPRSGYDLNPESFTTNGDEYETPDIIPAADNEPLEFEVIPLRINPDSNPFNDDQAENEFESPIDSVQQIQELAQRLNQNELELQQRESDLEQRITDWNQTVTTQQNNFETRLNQLDQQAAQVRCQQMHLMQLQSDIVKSHEATREAIENLVVADGVDAESVRTLKALTFQLGGRFDYITRRWEHLAKLLNDAITRNVAQQATDDSVDWQGELS